MLDGWIRKRIDPALNGIARPIAGAGISANAVTICGFAVGAAAAIAIISEAYVIALILLLFSRLADGVDGAVARISGKTDYGGYLDIVLDFFFYGSIPFAFVVVDPATNAVAGAALILSFYVNGASFLAYATIAEKRKLTTHVRGEKSLYFTTGLAEASETVAVFIVFCLFPAWFSIIAWSFAAVCFYTATARIIMAAKAFRD